MILNETLDFFKEKHETLLKATTISRANIGLFFTAVQLSSGYCGLASTDMNLVNCCPQDRKKEFDAFSPGKISGQTLFDLLIYTNGSKILEIVKLAALNAFSAALIAKSNYHIIEDKDPIELIDLDNKITVCVVGAFYSYIRKIANSPSKLILLELNENVVSDDFKKYYVPADKASEVFPQSDVIIITGSTLMNNTIDHILDLIPDDKKVIMVGPTAGLYPDILFKHGINIIGSTRIIDADKTFQAISEGAAGYHLFHNNNAQKICLLNDSK